MTKVKAVIRDEEELTAKLRTRYDVFFASVSQSLSSKASRDKIGQILNTVALLLAVGPGVVGFLYVVTYVNQHGFDFPILILIGSFVVVLGVLTSLGNKFRSPFGRQLDRMVYDYILDTLEIKSAQHKKSATHPEIRQQIRRSGLTNQAIKYIMLDDRVQFSNEHSEKPNFITEVKIRYHPQHQVASPFKLVNWLFRPAMQTSVTSVVRGYFLSVQLPQAISSRVFITSKQQLHEYGSDGAIDRLLASLDQEWVDQWTELEWNDFESLFAVAGGNQREVREVLTPDLMIDLYEWAKNTSKLLSLFSMDSTFIVCCRTSELILTVLVRPSKKMPYFNISLISQRHFGSSFVYQRTLKRRGGEK